MDRKFRRIIEEELKKQYDKGYDEACKYQERILSIISSLVQIHFHDYQLLVSERSYGLDECSEVTNILKALGYKPIGSDILQSIIDEYSYQCWIYEDAHKYPRFYLGDKQIIPLHNKTYWTEEGCNILEVSFPKDPIGLAKANRGENNHEYYLPPGKFNIWISGIPEDNKLNLFFVRKIHG